MTNKQKMINAMDKWGDKLKSGEETILDVAKYEKVSYVTFVEMWNTRLFDERVEMLLSSLKEKCSDDWMKLSPIVAANYEGELIRLDTEDKIYLNKMNSVSGAEVYVKVK